MQQSGKGKEAQWEQERDSAFEMEKKTKSAFEKFGIAKMKSDALIPTTISIQKAAKQSPVQWYKWYGLVCATW